MDLVSNTKPCAKYGMTVLAFGWVGIGEGIEMQASCRINNI